VIVRIRADLDASSFTLLELDEVAAGRSALAQLAAQHQAIAALRIRAVPRSAELWTADAAADAPGALDVIMVAGSEAHADEVLALRVVETLRARSLSLTRVEAAPPAPEQPPSVPKTQAPEPEPSAGGADAIATPHALQLWLELAPSLTLSPGGFGPELGAALSVRVQPLSFLSLAGFAVVPLWRDEVAVDEGSASMATWLLGVAADLHVQLAPIELSGGLGIASVIEQLDGSAAAPFEGRSDTERLAAPFARVAFHLALGAGLRLCTRALIGLAVPELSLQVEQREHATWGRPFVLVSVGLELPLLP
jgi:hypothetical protein